MVGHASRYALGWIRTRVPYPVRPLPYRGIEAPKGVFMRRVTDGARTRDLLSATIRITPTVDDLLLSQKVHICRGYVYVNQSVAYRRIPPDIIPTAATHCGDGQREVLAS